MLQKTAFCCGRLIIPEHETDIAKWTLTCEAFEETNKENGYNTV